MHRPCGVQTPQRRVGSVDVAATQAATLRVVVAAGFAVAVQQMLDRTGSAGVSVSDAHSNAKKKKKKKNLREREGARPVGSMLVDGLRDVDGGDGEGEQQCAAEPDQEDHGDDELEDSLRVARVAVRFVFETQDALRLAETARVSGLDRAQLTNARGYATISVMLL